MLPVAISGRNGFIQAYILPGETPMLMGRPIMEAIGRFLTAKSAWSRSVRSWEEIIVGLNGEYLLALQDFNDLTFGESPRFELVVPADGGIMRQRWKIQEL